MIRRKLHFEPIYRQLLLLYSHDSSVVDENGDAAECIQRSFHNGGTLGDDVVRVGDSLATSFAPLSVYSEPMEGLTKTNPW